MTQNSVADQCQNSTQTITIDIPCGLAELAERHTKEHDNTLSGVVIEALGAFLRRRSSGKIV